MIDDTITTGGSSLQAVAAMRAAGATVTRAFALVERGEGAADAFAREGLNTSISSPPRKFARRAPHGVTAMDAPRHG